MGWNPCGKIVDILEPVQRTLSRTQIHENGLKNIQKMVKCDWRRVGLSPQTTGKWRIWRFWSGNAKITNISA